ncbi:hypothetical protein J437_LFUL001234 [Ladona fulva]|uniref:Uncharacterized protein n=1 Tax=Ladona fulva TaxID=123851 RepID=A0A8K0NVE8_LADFU|nr:hypothetical protein J437_LFUL001234 [Ladona fulva]
MKTDPEREEEEEASRKILRGAESPVGSRGLSREELIRRKQASDQSWMENWISTKATEMDNEYWNLKGIRNKQQEVVNEMMSRNIDIAILSETKKKGNGTENLKECIHCYGGVERVKELQWCGYTYMKEVKK